MALRVAENRVLYRIPLNAADDLESLIFFHGLDAFGVVAPHLGSRRPVLTRQAYYVYPELPKALYLFAPLDSIERQAPAERHEFIFSRADAYLFRWNETHPESRLNARGNSPDFEPDRDGQYIHCDGGHTWVHDPMHCDPDERDPGPFWANAEATASGRTLLDARFDQYERAVGGLLQSWVIACYRFDLLPDKYRTESGSSASSLMEERYSRLVPKDMQPTPESLNATAEWLLSLVPSDHPLRDNIHFRDEVFTYQPVTADVTLLSYREVQALERMLLGLGHDGDRDGIETILKDPRRLKHYVQPFPLDTPIPHEHVRQESLYSGTAMSYFLAGLNGDRPHAQVLGYFQALEHAMHTQLEKGGLQPLLEAMPDAVLGQCYTTAIGGEADALQARGPNGGLNRATLMNLITKEMRDPSVHAGNPRPGQLPPVDPYAAHQFQPRFRQTVAITREIARYWVSQTASSAIA